MSMISKIPLKFCVPLLALASCAVHADETNPQQFVFGNYGTYLKNLYLIMGRLNLRHMLRINIQWVLVLY